MSEYGFCEMIDYFSDFSYIFSSRYAKNKGRIDWRKVCPHSSAFSLKEIYILCTKSLAIVLYG